MEKPVPPRSIVAFLACRPLQGLIWDGVESVLVALNSWLGIERFLQEG